MNATALPPAPPGEVKPEWTCFIGAVMYGGFTLAILPELFESEEMHDAIRLKEFDYHRFPAYQALGVTVGFASYALAFRLPENPVWQLTCYGHTLLAGVVFYLLAKHLSKLADLSSRRASMVVSLGMLPLLCKSVLEAESVRVHNCSSFYALLMCLVLLPLMMILREFRSAPTNRYRKRLLLLYFSLTCYYATLTPRTLCSATRTDFAKNAGFLFDITMLLIPNLDV